MGEVIYFDKKRIKTLTKEARKDADLSERIERIKASIARISELMAELRDGT